MESLARSRKGCAGGLPIDEALFVIVVLVAVFGYTPHDAALLTGRIGYWAFVLVVGPLALLALTYLVCDGAPVGGEDDDWWLPYAGQVHQRIGIERLDRLSLHGAQGDGHGHAHGARRCCEHG